MIIKCAEDTCTNYLTITEATDEKAGDEPALIAANCHWSIHHNLKGETVYLCAQHAAERIESMWKGHHA